MLLRLHYNFQLYRVPSGENLMKGKFPSGVTEGNM